MVQQMLNLTDDKHPDRPYLQIAMKILLEIENTYEKVKRKLERLFNIQNNISGEHEVRDLHPIIAHSNLLLLPL